MPVPVNIQTVHPRKLAAVRRKLSPRGRRGRGRLWARFGPLFAAGQAYGPMATTFFSTTTRLRLDGSRAPCYRYDAGCERRGQPSIFTALQNSSGCV